MFTMKLLFFHEQVKGQNLLKNCKTEAIRTENGQILYRTSEIKRFVQEMSESCTGRRCGLANLLGIDFANAAGRNHLRKMPNMVLPLPDIAA